MPICSYFHIYCTKRTGVCYGRPGALIEDFGLATSDSRGSPAHKNLTVVLFSVVQRRGGVAAIAVGRDDRPH